MPRNQANRLLLLAALLWGSGNVAQQTILESIGPFLAVGLRCMIAGLVITPFLFVTGKGGKVFELASRKLGLLTVLSFVMALTFQQIGFGHTTVTNGGFIVNTTTVITPFIGWLLLMRRPALIVWLAGLLSLTGTGLMSGGSLQGFNFGDLLCLASAVSFSFWMVFLGEFVRRHGNAMRLTLVQFFVSGLVCLSISYVVEPISLRDIKGALPELIVLGVLSTGVAYMLQSIAQRYTSANEAAIITSGEAFFGAMAAFILLGETPSVVSGLGAILIFGGVLLVQIPDRRFFALNSRRPVRYQLDLARHEREIAD
jgi:drug/metabolite transporter (DMT)-like permease